MLFPRFQLRTALIGLSVAPLIGLVVRDALREAPWAIGVVVGLASLVLLLVVHALFFGLAMLLSLGVKEESAPTTRNRP